MIYTPDRGSQRDRFNLNYLTFKKTQSVARFMVQNVILAIFAHPDDELGCIGTLANHVDAGDDVHLLFLTRGENASTIPGTPEDRIKARKEHTKQIEKLIGLKVHFLDFPDSHLEYSVEGAYKVAEQIKRIRPNAIITWNLSKILGAGHPDHRNTSKLVFDALSYSRYRKEGCPYDPLRTRLTLYMYTQSYDPRERIVYIDVTDQYDKIMKFIEIYKKAYGDWPVDDYKKGSMLVMGRYANVKYAEGFIVINQGYPASKLLQVSKHED